MKYHDNQPARKGDKFVMGMFGTCRIESIDAPAHAANVRNVCTGERWELDSLQDADLIERDALTVALFAAESVAHLRGYEREILPLADLARGMQARIDELESVARELLELVDGFHMHTYAPNKSSDWKQQARAREVLARPVSPLTPDNIKS